MAEGRFTRGRRSIGFFADLNSVSTADFAPHRIITRKTVEHGRLFEVDRLITNRQGKEVSLCSMHAMLRNTVCNSQVRDFIASIDLLRNFQQLRGLCCFLIILITYKLILRNSHRARSVV